MSKYIEFFPGASKPRTKTWGIVSKSSGDLLGVVEWYGPWRQYCFFPEEGMVFSKGCLEDINAFIEEHKNDRVEVPA